MNLILFNMSNLNDWKSGVVNRNYFVVRELIKSNKYDEIILVDFLAIQSIKKIFGKQRTIDYAKWWYASGYKKIHRFHGAKEVSTDEIFGVPGTVTHIAGLGILSKPSVVIDALLSYLGTKQIHLEDTIIWNYNAFLPQVHELAAHKTIFDTVDNWAHHASYKKEAGLLQSNYDAIAQEADIIYTVSKGLLNLFNHEQVHWVPNGVDFDLFKSVQYKDQSEQVSVGYIGTIQERVDLDLVEKICLDHPDKAFDFYGPIWKGVEASVKAIETRHENLTFHGRIAYRRLPEILNTIDVTIIPHRLDDFLASTNPMKMYDYLAAGRPVVTTPGAGTEDFAEVLLIEEEADGFSSAINTALQTNTPDLMEKRRESVKLHTWEQRVDTMHHHLQELT